MPNNLIRKSNLATKSRLSASTPAVSWRGLIGYSVLTCLLVVSSSCALVKPPQPPPETYDISAPRNFSGLKNGSRAQILVKAPSALKALDSQNIVVKPAPTVITYLSDAQWSDVLPKMVQTKLVETFENTGRAGAVAKPGDGLVIDYQILSSIRSFQVVAKGDTKTAQVELSVKLLNDRNGRVLRSRIFSASASFSGSKNDDYVNALDGTFDKVAGEIVIWVLGRI